MAYARITLNISLKEQGEGSGTVDLKDDFDEARGKWMPINPPASALEQQANLTYTKADGNRVCINPNAIFLIEEIEDGD